MIGRVFRMVRTPITLLILLGVLCYGAWWGYKNVLAEIPPPPPEACVQQKVAKGELKTSQVVVSIYNGGDKRGLAADIGRQMRERGFKVRSTDNTLEKIQKTVIIGAGAKDPEVILVKSFFKDSVVTIDKNKTDHSVDVMVGTRYAGFNSKAKTSLPVKATTVCLPAQSKPPSPALGG